MGQQIERLARLVAETSWEAIPETVRAQARLVLLDTFGVILAGSTSPEVANLRAALAGSDGVTVYAEGFPGAEPRTAALLNGIAGRTPELCEGHRFASCQAAVQAVPTVLALAEQRGASGQEALAALILGYEVAARIGLAATPRAMAHQNGQWPMLGAVAAGARLRGLDAAQTSLALRIGAVLVLTPSYANVAAGATALNVAGGMCGVVGQLAPELALAGFEARPDAIEEAFSGLVGDGFAPERVDQELGQRWEIGRNWFRLRGCCNPIYSALDALEHLLAELRPDPAEIARIEVATYRFASVMNNPAPPNPFAARYSLPQAAAAMVVRGDAGYRSFTEEALRDPAIVALRPLVQIEEDPALTSQVPRLKPARVTVTLQDGRRATASCDSARGDFQQPYSQAELHGKFRELAGLVLPASKVAALEALLDRFERVADVRELPELLRSR
jgi:2-methylcitrate dehydratase PrpD